MSVTAVLVSHGGARWLPAVLAGLRDQTCAPDRVVAVDTGSRDDSLALLTRALGPEHLRTAGRQASFAEAIDLGLELDLELAARPDGRPGRPPDWIWILHDDANPAPTALAELLAAADVEADADIFGPKLREWPSLRRLLEVGVTISATGRRETGLERGEYDQGQHDDVRQVLAVNTAGMLVRRRVLRELGGFDRALPIFGNDIDFGWRAAAAGRRTLVVPQAVVFHAEAAHRGTRRTSLTGRHTHYQERRAALYTLLVNSPARALPLRVVRLAIGTFVRVLGFVLVRSVGEARDELAALLSVYSRPRLLVAARRARRPIATADAAAVRGLLAPWWLPYRHGLDVVSDLVAAAGNQAQDVGERRQLATSPVALAVAAFLAAVLIGARQAWGSVSGGALAPAPAAVVDWWRLYGEPWHPLGLGSDVPAPVYLLPLSLLGTVAGGPAAAVSLVLVLAVPVALWGAWRLIRAVGRLLDPRGLPSWLIGWGSATYALVPAVSGAWGGGRLGPVVVAATVPWLAHAALGLADPERDRRWRAGWRTGLLLALGTAFGAPLFLCMLVMVVVVLALTAVVNRPLVLDPSVVGPPLVALGVVPLVLAPWWVPLLGVVGPGGMVLDPGRLPLASVGLDGLLLGRLDGGGAPAWWATPVLVMALVALILRGSRRPALVCWTVALVGAMTAAVVTAPSVAVTTGPVQPSAASLTPVIWGALVVAAVTGGLALVRCGWFAGGLRRWTGVLLAVAALAVPAAGAVWFAAGGHGDLRSEEASAIPAYMSQASELGPEHGVLVVRGDVENGLRYLVRRGDGDTVGESEILALTPEDVGFSRTLRALVSRPTPEVVAALAGHGVEYVVLPEPADSRLAAQLDAAVGLTQASAENRATRAWQVDQEPTWGPVDGPADGPVDGPGSALRTTLLMGQALALVVVGVLCGPVRSRRR